MCIFVHTEKNITLIQFNFIHLPSYLYNCSHKLSSNIQRVVLHHVEGHCTHHQHMQLVMQVHTAAEQRHKASRQKLQRCE